MSTIAGLVFWANSGMLGLLSRIVEAMSSKWDIRESVFGWSAGSSGVFCCPYLEEKFHVFSRDGDL